MAGQSHTGWYVWIWLSTESLQITPFYKVIQNIPKSPLPHLHIFEIYPNSSSLTQKQQHLQDLGEYKVENQPALLLVWLA
jgi:hypothetical protein